MKYGPSGKAKAFVLASNKSSMLGLTEFPMYGAPLQFKAQILNTESECWEANFDNAVVPFKKNDTKILKAKSQ
jgi:hypothetical protein